MYRRAFLAVQYSVDCYWAQAWGTADVPWPPAHDDLEDAARRIAADSSKDRAPDSVVLTALTWISDVRET